MKALLELQLRDCAKSRSNG